MGCGQPQTHRPLLLPNPGAWAGRGPPTLSSACPSHPSPHNTLYLELWCPTVAPSVVVTSHKGKTIFNFGDVAVGETLSPTHTSTRCPGTPMPPLAPRPTPDRGAPWGLGLGLGPDAPRPISGHRSIKKVSIQNVSPEDLAVSLSTQPRRPAGWEWGWGGCGGACRHPCPLLDMDPQLDFSLLNPNGPFVLLNHSSLLRAGETQVLVLSFSPHESILVSPRPTPATLRPKAPHTAGQRRWPGRASPVLRPGADHAWVCGQPGPGPHASRQVSGADGAPALSQLRH